MRVTSIFFKVFFVAAFGTMNAQNPLTAWGPQCSAGGLYPPGSFNVYCSTWGNCPADAPMVRIIAAANAWGTNCQYNFRLNADSNANFRGAEVFATSSGNYQGGIGDYQIERSCYGYIFEGGGWYVPFC